MIIKIYNRQKDLKISKKHARNITKTLLEFLHITTDEIAVHFISNQTMIALHEQFFADPTPTDCISFPIDPPQQQDSSCPHYHVLGEVFVCPKVAMIYATRKGLDPYEETKLYVVHGILHLIGYDDMTPAAKKQMRKMEKTCIQSLHPLSLAPDLS